MMDKVRWGLLSTANINRRLIPAIRASARGELVAVASRSLAPAQAYAAEWDIPQAYGSYAAMLESGQVDAVYIGLPNHLHAEWTVRSLETGVHVLCEKPFALTLEDVDRMAFTARRTGLVLAEAFMYRHHPQTKLVGELVRSGRLGEIVLARGVFNFYMDQRLTERGYRNVRLEPEWGGGSLWDVGVYPVSMAQFVMGGPPEAVSGFQWVGESGVDEAFAGLLRYPGDRLAEIGCSFRSPFYISFDLQGTDGRLVVTRPFNGMEEGQVTLFPRDGEPQELAVPDEDLYLGEVEDMHAAILDGAPTYLSLEETRNHVRTVLALYEAARSGGIVRL